MSTTARRTRRPQSCQPSRTRGCASSVTSTRLGLAGALNRGLDEVRGRYVARMDADDIALPHWLARVLPRLESEPEIALVGAGVVEFTADRGLGQVHVPEPGPAVTRWHSLFSASPFFHNTVAFDNELFQRHRLRYDESFGESEDFELWTRVLALAEADAVAEALVLYRLHPEQASRRRSELQRSLGRRVALAQIAAAAPSLTEPDVELAWRFGFRLELEPEELEQAAYAYLELFRQFSGSARYSHDELSGVREAAARTVARRARSASGVTGARLLRAALAIDPALGVHVVGRRARRAEAGRRVRKEARELLRAETSAVARSASPPSSPSRRRTGRRSSIRSQRSTRSSSRWCTPPLRGQRATVGDRARARRALPPRASHSRCRARWFATTTPSLPASRVLSSGHGPTSSSSPAGARLPPRPRSPGAVSGGSRTCSSWRATTPARDPAGEEP